MGFAALHPTYNGEVGFPCASPNLQWESWVSLRFTQPTKALKRTGYPKTEVVEEVARVGTVAAGTTAEYRKVRP
ncbi:hypothetical protein SPLC1_S532920 [Arthrospira platensis C1]|nr:hypothetical protein SPLC1_S532920 [Arthrospira platensis C1]